MSALLLPLGATELADGEMRSIKVEQTTLLVARVADQHYALDDWCNHAGCLLSGGRIERSIVICPCHEVGFDLRTGKVATQPALCDDQTVFPVAVRDGQLYVEFPDPAAKVP